MAAIRSPFSRKDFRKKIDKSIPGLSYGFHDPVTWISTGCYALNYLISGRFDGGIPLEGKFTMFAGDSGSGKSYIATANFIRDCQAKGIYCVVFDTENALDEAWLKALDVDTSPDAMEMVKSATVDDVSKAMGEIIDLYKAQNDSVPYDQRPKLAFIIDSIGMLITPNQEKQYMEGDQKGDMGLKAKQITNMLRVTLAKIASQPIGLIGTNHVYDSQDQYQPDKIAGGKMLEFASSVIVQMNKYLLKEDDHGKELPKGATARGIRSTAVVRKSRYAKPFEKIKIDIPYEEGMNPYSGLYDLFKGKGLLTLVANRWQYICPKTGEVLSEFRKDLVTSGLYDRIMADREHWEARDLTKVGVGDLDPPAEGAE